LATVSVGRVGISSQALPAVLPVNFVFYDRVIFFRTVPGTKLDAAVSGAVVAFEADHLGSAQTESWSVLIRGLAEEVTDSNLRVQLDPLVPDSWALEGDADHLVSIPVTMVSGRRIRALSGGEWP
jgi:nitroimidazol reductase NimA-like FMN-containing flavoprotein (pyridoxamine 5'-phosphate oxidase superfamily)